MSVTKAVAVFLAILLLLMAAAAWGQTDELLGPHNTNNTFGCQSCHAPHSQVLAGEGLYLWGLSVPSGTYKTYGGSYDSTGKWVQNTLTANLQSGVAPTDTTPHTVLCLSCHDQSFNPVMGGTGKDSSGNPVVIPTYNMSQPISNFTGSGDGMFTTIGGGVTSGSFDLSSNHPVHVLYPNGSALASSVYDAQTQAKYWAITGGTTFTDTSFGYGHTARLFSADGANGYVECATCHNPHSQNVAVVKVKGVPTTVATAHFIRGEYDNIQSQSAFCMSCHADKSAVWNGTGQQ